MTKHISKFEATEGGLTLTNAILLYSSGEQYGRSREAFASIHDVDHVDGQPIIAAGMPLTREHLRRWTEALGKALTPEILPDNVLVAHPDMLAWWVPEQVRMSYFALSSPTATLKALAQRTTLPLPYPAHLFVATRGGLGVYALPANKRPTADTQLLFSPVLNVFTTGALCWGNIRKPKALNIAAIPEYERAVFDSWSTHPNAGQEMTVTGNGGLVALWDDLAARKAQRFPVRRLKPFNAGKPKGAPITFGQLIARAGA